MKITLQVEYRTNWGEAIYVVGSLPQLGSDNEDHALPLELEGNQQWTVTFEVSPAQACFSYRYFMKNDNGYVRREWGAPHRIDVSPKTPIVKVYDQWQDMPWDKPYYSSAFTDCICSRPNRSASIAARPGTLTLEVQAPMIKDDEALAISGNEPVVGNWDTRHCVVMNDAQFPRWTVELPLDKIRFPLEYKFLIVKRDGGAVVAWEASDNHRLNMVPSTHHEAIIVAGRRFASPL